MTASLPRQRGLQLRRTAGPLTQEADLHLLEVYQNPTLLQHVPVQLYSVVHWMSSQKHVRIQSHAGHCTLPSLAMRMLVVKCALRQAQE